MENEQQSMPVSGNSKTILWILIMAIFVGGFIFIINKNEITAQSLIGRQVKSKRPDSLTFASLAGTWVGSAYQADIKEHFDLKLTCTKGKYTIEYPSIGCGGEWKLTDSTSEQIVFEEELKYGQDICNNAGTVVITFENKEKLKFQYYFPNLDTLNATGFLHKAQFDH